METRTVISFVLVLVNLEGCFAQGNCDLNAVGANMTTCLQRVGLSASQFCSQLATTTQCLEDGIKGCTGDELSAWQSAIRSIDFYKTACRPEILSTLSDCTLQFISTAPNICYQNPAPGSTPCQIYGSTNDCLTAKFSSCSPATAAAFLPTQMSYGYYKAKFCAANSCDVTSCFAKQMSLLTANMQDACKGMTEAAQCFQGVIDNCTGSQMINQSQVDQMKKIMTSFCSIDDPGCDFMAVGRAISKCPEINITAPTEAECISIRNTLTCQENVVTSSSCVSAAKAMFLRELSTAGSQWMSFVRENCPLESTCDYHELSTKLGKCEDSEDGSEETADDCSAQKESYECQKAAIGLCSNSHVDIDKVKADYDNQCSSGRNLSGGISVIMIGLMLAAKKTWFL